MKTFVKKSSGVLVNRKVGSSPNSTNAREGQLKALSQQQPSFDDIDAETLIEEEGDCAPAAIPTRPAASPSGRQPNPARRTNGSSASPQISSRKSEGRSNNPLVGAPTLQVALTGAEDTEVRNCRR